MSAEERERAVGRERVLEWSSTPVAGRPMTGKADPACPQGCRKTRHTCEYVSINKSLGLNARMANLVNSGEIAVARTCQGSLYQDGGI